MIEEWLDALLPASVAPLQGRITLLVTPVPSFGKARVSRFADREDLIRCNMASIHLVRLSAAGRACATARGALNVRVAPSRVPRSPGSWTAG